MLFNYEILMAQTFSRFFVTGQPSAAIFLVYGDLDKVILTQGL
jgi:hypothetical protein